MNILPQTNVSMSNIASMFSSGKQAPFHMSNYYKGQQYVTSNDTNPNVIPLNNAISIGNFRGALKGALTAPPISDYAFWLDANDASTFTFSGANVATWVDKVASRSMSVLTGTMTRGTSSAFGGKNVVTFANGTMRTLLNTTTWDLANISVFYVFKPSESSATGGYNGSSQMGLWSIYKTSTNSIDTASTTPELQTYCWISGSKFPFTQKAITSSGYPELAYTLLDKPFNTGQILHTTRSNGTVTHFWNGSSIATTSSGQPTTLPTVSTNYFSLGRMGMLGSTIVYGGNVAEVIVYNRPVSISEGSSIVSYLKGKWSLP